MWIKRLDVRMILPVILIGILGGYGGAKLIERQMSEHIATNYELRLEIFKDEQIFLLQNSFKTLFYQFGDSETQFQSLLPSVQKEAIANLQHLYHERADFDGMLLTPDGKIPLHGKLNQDVITSVLQQQKADYGEIAIQNRPFFYQTFHFVPWDWKIIILADKQPFLEIVTQNQIEIFFVFFLAIIAIITALILTVTFGIKRPLAEITGHLEGIQQGDYTPLPLNSALEMERLNQDINHTASMISQREAEIHHQLHFTQQILDSQASIVLITDTRQLLGANRRLFELLTQYPNLDAFRKEHECICDFFEPIEMENYIYVEDREKDYWVEQVLEDSTTHWKVAIEQPERGIRYFGVMANRLSADDGKMRDIIVLTDITDAENYRLHLEHRIFEAVEKNRLQDRVIHEQTKRHSMNELISNLAHHWRQPLNVIALELQEIMDVLEFEEGNREKIHAIVEKANDEIQKISRTISILGSKYKITPESSCQLTTVFNDTMVILKQVLDAVHVNVLTDFQEDFTLPAPEAMVLEIFSALFYNVRETVIERKLPRATITLTAIQTDTGYRITIADNAGGFDESLLPDRLFDPYTTTHFKSRDKGLGLFSVKNIVLQQFGGSITAANVDSGAQITIDIPFPAKTA